MFKSIIILLILLIFKGHNCIVSGWGRQASGGATKPDTLQKVNESFSLFIGNYESKK